MRLGNGGFIKEYILKRIKNNKNFLGCFVGGTGSGKSYSALRLAEELDPNFTIKQLVFKSKEFMQLVKKLPRGSVIIFDEAGTKEGMATRNWYSIQNKMLSYVMQIFRHKNLVVLFTVPDISYIDVQARKLFHMLFVTAGIDRKRNFSKVKPYIISPSKTYNKIYYVYPTVRTEKGRSKVKKLKFKIPTLKLRRNYEKQKEAFAEGLYSDALEQLGDSISLDALTDRERTIYELRKHTELSQQKIGDSLGVSNQAIAQTLRKISKKGYNLTTNQ